MYEQKEIDEIYEEGRMYQTNITLITYRYSPTSGNSTCGGGNRTREHDARFVMVERKRENHILLPRGESKSIIPFSLSHSFTSVTRWP